MRSAMILGIVDDIIDAITGMIGNFLFGLLGGIFFMFIDWVQGLFRSLAGLGPIKIDGKLVNNVEGGRQDLVWWLIQTDVVQDVFWSLVTFSLILMFLMTGLAIIRNAYQDKPKPIGDIIGGVFKGLLGMILLPIACMVGLMFGNIILLAVDKGTSASGATTLSGTLFISAAYDANIARDPWDDDDTGFFSGLTTREERYQAFLLNSNFEEYLKKNGGDKYTSINPDSNWSEDEWNEVADFIDNAFVTGQIKDGFGIPLTLYTAGNVSWCYRTWSISYLVLVVGGCIMLGFLFKMCFGMIGRLFKLTIDFVMIPVVMAMMPFDTKPSQSWKGDFVKNTTLAYTTVGVMNIYFSILPIVNKIEFNGANGFFLNIVLKLILTIVGLFSAESIISSVGGWFGTGDLIKEGAATYKTYTDGLKTVTDKAKKPIGAGAKFIGAYKQTAKNRADAGEKKSFWANAAGAFTNTAGAWAANKANDNFVRKAFGEGKDSIKKNKEAGGWDLGFHSKEVQDEMKNKAQIEKDRKKLQEDLEKLKALLDGKYISQEEYDKRKTDAIINSGLASNFFGNKGEFGIQEKDENGAYVINNYDKGTYDAKVAAIEKKKTSAQDVVTFAEELDEKAQKRTETLENLRIELGVLGITAGNTQLDTSLIEERSDGTRRTKIEDGKVVDDKSEMAKAAELITKFNEALKPVTEGLKDDKKAEIAQKYAKIDSSYDIKITLEDGKTKSLKELSDEEKEKYAEKIKNASIAVFETMAKKGFDKVAEKAAKSVKDFEKEAKDFAKKATDAMEKIITTSTDLKKFIKKEEK